MGLDFRFNVDPDILGGLLIRVGDKLLDTSVASRLVAMRQSLGLAAS
ncbi:MAG: F0F1 ATP synthase subunit delta [Anaerolineae bacterium]|nr:F0F1 ATP synthase subunit delta [Anaerolineae bacterium]